MGLLDQGIDVSNIESNNASDNTPFPEGDYTLAAALYEEQTSKAGNEMIKIEFNVVGPTHAGRKVWDYFVLNQQVGLSRLKSFVGSTGQDASQVLNTDMLRSAMGKHFTASIKIEPGSGGYSDSNKIASYKSGKGSAPAAVQPQAPQQAQATPAPGLNTANVDWSG